MWRLHCDKEGCDHSRKAYPPPVIPDPWIIVEGDRLPGKKLAYCNITHAIEGLAEAAKKMRR